MRKAINNKVIHGISFEVYKGEILCFLGPNGAGKTTTINILTGALGYDNGVIKFKDAIIKKDLTKFKQVLGVVPQELSLYEDLTAGQNVRFFASLYGLKGNELIKQCENALQFAGLSDKADDKVKTFSGGMKRRLNIACAIAHNPEVLIMDEPTVGIDPQSRNHILDSIKKLRDNGMTILYTTHYMEEVEEISSRIIIMDNGRIIAQGTKEELKENIENERQYLIEVESPDHVQADAFYKVEGVKNAVIRENRLEVGKLGKPVHEKYIRDYLDTPVKDRSLDSQIMYCRILQDAGDTVNALSLLDEVLAISRKNEIRLKIVEASLLKITILMKNACDKREILNLFKECIYYACEDRILLPFHFEKNTVQELNNRYHSELSASFQEEERIFLYDVFKLCNENKDTGILSERELDVLKEIASGLSNKEISDRLCISVATVKSHIINIYGKLQVNSRLNAVESARQKGIL